MTYRKHRGRLVLGLLGLALSAAAAQAGNLDGAWTARDATVNGKPAPNIVGHVLTIEGDRFRIARDGKLLFGGGLQAERDTPAGGSPAAIRFDQTATDTFRGVWLGIYEFDGGALTICDNANDRSRPRPASFAACAAPGYTLVRFTR